MREMFRARWVLPIARPPIANGWVTVEDGKIAGVGEQDDAPGWATAESDGGVLEAVILPGLVNAHTHLELSGMRNRVPPASSMLEWVESLMALRPTVGTEPSDSIREAIAETRTAGTTLVGDVTNTLAPYGPLAASSLSAAIFRELLGFSVSDGEAVVRSAREQITALPSSPRIRVSIVPHAPYSVSSPLLRAIAAAGDGPLCIHLGESAEEIEFLASGEGPWRVLLEKLGVWSSEWRPPATGGVDYLASQGLLHDRLIAVHCVQLSDAELRKLAGAGATVVTCPRSNRWTGAGVAPIERFYGSGVRVAVGTDSLASVEDLNVFAELTVMRELGPAVPARDILASATKHGADALGFGGELGTIEPGKRAELIAVAVPGVVTDVEEYLLSGIEPERISWLSTSPVRTSHVAPSTPHRHE